MQAPPQRPLPVPTTETRPYWEAAHAGRLVVQHCKACARHQFYPRPFCAHCLSDEIEWVEASGLGRIYTFTICRIAANPAMVPPYAVALVELDEGVRLLSNIVDCETAAIHCGSRVQVRFERISDQFTLPQFTLIQEPQ